MEPSQCPDLLVVGFFAQEPLLDNRSKHEATNPAETI